MGSRNKGQKKGRATGRKGKKANKTSNPVDTPSPNPASSNTNEVATTNRAQNWGPVSRFDWLKNRSDQQDQKTGAATTEHASGAKCVKSKNPKTTQNWDPNGVFAPSAIRQHEWKLQQHDAACKNDATGPNDGSVYDGVSSQATTPLPPNILLDMVSWIRYQHFPRSY